MLAIRFKLLVHVVVESISICMQFRLACSEPISSASQMAGLHIITTTSLVFLSFRSSFSVYLSIT